MAARYPAELVWAPLPAEFDLRKLYPVTFDDQQHEVAKKIFNQRIDSGAMDLTRGDVVDGLGALDVPGQVQVFIALFQMFGAKLGAIKYRCGIA